MDTSRQAEDGLLECALTRCVWKCMVRLLCHILRISTRTVPDPPRGGAWSESVWSLVEVDVYSLPDFVAVAR